jgi:hypothetical protein
MSKRPKARHKPPSGKQARQSLSPDLSKTPRIAFDPTRIEKATPTWKFGRFDVDGPWGHAQIDRKILLQDILPKLRNYESMSWSDIVANRHHNHSVPIHDLISKARQRLDDLGIEDDTLFRFRLTGTQRVWGIRDRDAFYILWWDPDHEICPSPKKHT